MNTHEKAKVVYISKEAEKREQAKFDRYCPKCKKAIEYCECGYSELSFEDMIDGIDDTCSRCGELLEDCICFEIKTVPANLDNEESDLYAIGYWVSHGDNHVAVMFLYSDLYEEANRELNPEYDYEMAYQLAKEYETAFDIQMKIYELPRYKSEAKANARIREIMLSHGWDYWETREEFESMHEFRQRAWLDMAYCLERLQEKMKN